MAPIVQITVGIILIVIAAVSAPIGGYLLKNGIKERNILNTIPSISFQKVSIFHIKADEDIYQVGLVVKLLNADDKTHMINGIVFDKISFDLVPRSTYYLRKVFLTKKYQKSCHVLFLAQVVHFEVWNK